ncbi:hypothetical protein ACFL2V_14130 [Pseudomonadota bacterium]
MDATTQPTAPMGVTQELRKKALNAAAKGNLIIAAQFYLQAANITTKPAMY